MTRSLYPSRTLRWSAAMLVGLCVLEAAWAVRRLPVDAAVPVAATAMRAESPTPFDGGLVYSALHRDRYQLSGKVPPHLPSGSHFLAPVSSDDGERLFFEVAREGHTTVWEIRKSGNARRWTDPELDCSEPAPSGRGAPLAAVCGNRLYVFDAPEKGRDVGIRGEVADPDFSPDGSRIVFSLRVDGRWRLNEWDSGSRATRTLGSGAGEERSARYSPDGKQLVFSRRSRGTSQLWLLDLKTGRERQITLHSANDTDPAWSNDGGTLYFASDRERGIFMPAIYRLALKSEPGEPSTPPSVRAAKGGR